MRGFYSQLKPRAKKLVYLYCLRQENYPGSLLPLLLLKRKKGALVLTFFNNVVSFRSPLVGSTYEGTWRGAAIVMGWVTAE